MLNKTRHSHLLFSLFFLTVFIFNIGIPAPGFANQSSAIRIFYSGNVKGETEPCG